jgi:hypothetical protein
VQNDAGLPALLIAALREHLGDEQLVKMVLPLIETMAQDRNVAKEFEQLGAVPAIHDVIDTHITHEEIPELGEVAIAAILGWEVKDAMDQEALASVERARLQREEEERLKRLEVERQRLAEIARTKDEADRLLKELHIARLHREEEERLQRHEAERMHVAEIARAKEEVNRLRKEVSEEEARRLAQVAEQRRKAEEESMRRAREAKGRLLFIQAEREEAERMRLAAIGIEAARLAAMTVEPEVVTVPKVVMERKKFKDEDDEKSKRWKHKRMKVCGIL